jgi:hypothetical protein
MGRDRPHERSRWLELAAAAANETDSSRLMELVNELCNEFERGEGKRMPGKATEDHV